MNPAPPVIKIRFIIFFGLLIFSNWYFHLTELTGGNNRDTTRFRLRELFYTGFSVRFGPATEVCVNPTCKRNRRILRLGRMETEKELQPRRNGQNKIRVALIGVGNCASS